MIKLDIKKVPKDFFGKLKGIGKFSQKDELMIQRLSKNTEALAPIKRPEKKEPMPSKRASE